MKIIAVVVTYNRRQLLTECIDALLNQTNRDFDILIIDNNSSDGTGEYCKNLKIERIIYYNTGANLGGAGGFAKGINYALSHNYDWCWVMDDDTIATRTALQSLVDNIKLSNSDISFIASIVRWKDGSSCKMNMQGLEPDWLGDGEKIENHMLKVKYSSFVSTMVNLKIAHEMGLPIAEMFIYGDDLEYTTRLATKAHGYVDMNSVVVHKMAENVGANLLTSTPERVERYFYNYRNRIYVCRK
jgi:GT2 family glycosyltransferase